MSLDSGKIPIALEISTHLNPKIPEQRSLAKMVLHTESVSFGKGSRRNKKFSLTFNLRRINKKGPSVFLFVPFL